MDNGDARKPEEDRLPELLAALSSGFEATNYDLGSEGALPDIISGRREISRANAKKLAGFFCAPVALFI